MSGSNSTSGANNKTDLVNVFNPTYAPSINISLNQNDSSKGRKDNLSNTSRSDQTNSNSTGSFAADTKGSFGQTSTSSQDLSQGQTLSQAASQYEAQERNDFTRSGAFGIVPAIAAAAGGYLMGYGLGLPTSESTTFAAVTGRSFLGAEMISQEFAEGNDLVSLAVSVGAGIGALYYFGIDPGFGAAIAAAGSGAGMSVKYLSTR